MFLNCFTLVKTYSAKDVTPTLNNVFEIRNLPNALTTEAVKNISKSRKFILELFCTGFSRKDLEDILP